MLPLSCDPLRMPRLAIRSWSWNFLWNFRFRYEVMRVDTFWYNLLRWDAIQSRFVNFRCHDQSRSDLPFRYDYIRSDRIVAIESTIGSGSDTIITIGFPELGRSDTCRYVPIRSSRTDALCYDCIRFWSRCFSRSWSRVITIWATTGPRWVYMQPDWPWASLFLELIQHKHLPSTIDDGRSCWWWQRGICNITV